MELIAHQLEVLVLVIEDGGRLAVDLQFAQLIGVARQLLLDLVKMIQVDVRISNRVDQFANLQVALLSDHVGEQGILGNVEGRAQEEIVRAHVQLTAQAAISNPELIEHVAGGKRHVLQIGYVPRIDDMTPGVWIFLDALDHPLDLVDRLPILAGPTDPLLSIDWPKISVLCRPGVPDVDVVVHEILDVGTAFQEPEHFYGESLEINFFRGNEGKACLQIETHLMAED